MWAHLLNAYIYYLIYHVNLLKQAVLFPILQMRGLKLREVILKTSFYLAINSGGLIQSLTIILNIYVNLKVDMVHEGMLSYFYNFNYIIAK